MKTPVEAKHAFMFKTPTGARKRAIKGPLRSGPNLNDYYIRTRNPVFSYLLFFFLHSHSFPGENFLTAP